MTVYQSFFSIQLSLCKLFPALTPFLIRREKAVDVFQLIKRIQEKNEYERIKELGGKKGDTIKTINGRQVIYRPASDNWF